MDRRTKISFVLAGVVLVLVLPMAAGLVSDVLSGGKSAGANGEFNQSNGPRVVVGESVNFTTENPWQESNQVTLQPVANFSSPGSSSVRVERFNGTWTNLSALEVSNALTVEVNDKQTVTIAGGADSFSFRDVALDDDTNDFEYSGPDGGTTTVTIRDLPTSTQIAAVAPSGTVLDVTTSNGSGAATFDLPQSSHAVRLQTSMGGPIVDDSSLSPNSTATTQEDTSITLSAEVDDPDFPFDELNATFYVDGEVVGSDTLTSAGTASVTVQETEGGIHTWHVEVEDAYGQTTSSATAEFALPGTLYIRDELNPEDLVNQSVNVTVRLFGDNTTVKRSVSNGTVDLSGLPIDERFVATTEAEGCVDRRIIIQDLTQQQTIYLLCGNETTRSPTFELVDKSGNFPPSESSLFIQKALNTSNTQGLEWKTITADDFSATQTFTATLAYQERYRILVRNSDGDVRALGSFIPSTGETHTLTIGNVIWEPAEGESTVFESSVNESSSRIRVALSGESVFDRVELAVYERGNESSPIYETTEYDIDSLVEYVKYNSSSMDPNNLVVSVEGYRGTNVVFEDTSRLGKPGQISFPIDQRWMALIAQVILVAIIGLVAGTLHRTGGIIVVGAAFGMTWFGWYSFHPAALGIAGVIALFAAANRGGGF
jgi:hypothetical protein